MDIDFEIDLDALIDPVEAERKEIKKQLDLLKLNRSLSHFQFEFMRPLPSNIFDLSGDLVTIDSPFEKEIKEDIANGEIKLPKLIDSINRSYADDNEIVHAFKFCVTDDEFNDHKRYFFIATMDGFFFFVNKKIAFVEYDALRSVRQDSNGVIISAWNVSWYSEDGADESGENDVIVGKNKETSNYLRALRKGLEKIIGDLGGYIESSDDKVEEIVAKYIRQIPNSSSSVPYIVKDFGWDDDKCIKRLKNALAKYALKVRQDEVVGFIDTSLLGLALLR